MNRREALAAVAGVLSGPAMSDALPVGSTMDAVCERPALLVISTPSHLSQEAAQRLSRGLVENLRGTALEGVRVLVLDGGLQFTALDAAGNVIGSTGDRHPFASVAESRACAGSGV